MTLVQKLIQVYEEIDNIQKAGHNKNQNYDFVRAADLVRAVRKALLKVGVYAEVNLVTEKQYTIARAEKNGQASTPFNAADVRCTIVFHDGDTSDTLTASGLGSGFDGGDKAVYKAQTGSIKYALRNAFLLPDEADPEADESVDEPPTSFQRQSQAIKAPFVSTQVPQAAIPNSAQTQTVIRPLTSNAPEPVKGVLPTPEQFEAYKPRFKHLCDDLALAGLKASDGLPSGVKLKVFMLQVAGVNDAKDMSIKQWETFFAIASETPVIEFIKAINLANGVEK
jgi:hypothetical protein